MGKDKGKGAVVSGGNPNHAPQEVSEDQNIAIFKENRKFL